MSPSVKENPLTLMSCSSRYVATSLFDTAYYIKRVVQVFNCVTHVDHLNTPLTCMKVENYTGYINLSYLDAILTDVTDSLMMYTDTVHLRTL